MFTVNQITEVRWASQNVAKVLVPHNFVTIFTQIGLEFLQAITETVENGLDVTALLHRDNTEMILLIDPDEEVLGFVVPDTAGVGPVTGLNEKLKCWKN